MNNPHEAVNMKNKPINGPVNKTRGWFSYITEVARTTLAPLCLFSRRLLFVFYNTYRCFHVMYHKMGTKYNTALISGKNIFRTCEAGFVCTRGPHSLAIKSCSQHNKVDSKEFLNKYILFKNVYSNQNVFFLLTTCFHDLNCIMNKVDTTLRDRESDWTGQKCLCPFSKSKNDVVRFAAVVLVESTNK